MLSNRLKMNDSKTEMTVFASSSVIQQALSVTVGRDLYSLFANLEIFARPWISVSNFVFAYEDHSNCPTCFVS